MDSAVSVEPRRVRDLLRVILERPDWMRQAHCLGVDTNLFFPERGEPTAYALSICSECDVRLQCLAFAISGAEREGIFGGTSARARRRLRVPVKAALAEGRLYDIA